MGHVGGIVVTRDAQRFHEALFIEGQVDDVFQQRTKRVHVYFEGLFALLLHHALHLFRHLLHFVSGVLLVLSGLFVFLLIQLL